jgi:hypothetical protein
VLKRGRKRKAPATPAPKAIKEEKESTVTEDKKAETTAAVTEEKTTEDNTPKEKPAKKAKKPQVEGMNSGVYNELEEKNFLEGLETYGRDWGKVNISFKEEVFVFIFGLYSFNNLLLQEIQILLEVMLRNILLKCLEIKFHFLQK